MDSLAEEISMLKKEKNAVILAHYYAHAKVQQIADYVGDSYYLSKIATKVLEKTILFCGVYFMAESAKILNPKKQVLIPDMSADCPLAHMVDIGRIKELREKYIDLAVVCYINSTAKVKTYADVCVTSSNAIDIVSALPNKYIYFIPDEHLGHYVASQVPGKTFLFNDGFCHVHTSISKENVYNAKITNPRAKVLVHPECRSEILELADYIGSTSGIIDYATQSDAEEFIICTEMGILYELEQKNPNKRFYFVEQYQLCSNMKRITLEKVYDALYDLKYEVEIEDELLSKANEPLRRMLELVK